MVMHLFSFQVKVGFVLNVVGVVILIASIESLGEYLFKLHSVPAVIMLNSTLTNTSVITY